MNRNARYGSLLGKKPHTSFSQLIAESKEAPDITSTIPTPRMAGEIVTKTTSKGKVVPIPPSLEGGGALVKNWGKAIPHDKILAEISKRLSQRVGHGDDRKS